MKFPKLQRSSTVYTAHKFRVDEEGFLLPDGQSITRSLIKHPGAVVIVPVLDDGSVCFVRQFRYAVQKPILELPAGTLVAGEDPLRCAERELEEEIGYRAASWHDLGMVYAAPGISDEVLYLFLAKSLTLTEQRLELGELLELERLGPPDIRAAIASGDLSDSKSLAAILRAQVLGEFRI